MAVPTEKRRDETALIGLDSDDVIVIRRLMDTKPVVPFIDQHNQGIPACFDVSRMTGFDMCIGDC